MLIAVFAVLAPVVLYVLAESNPDDAFRASRGDGETARAEWGDGPDPVRTDRE